MNFTDVDDARNGLLLIRPIERGYDDFRLSFIYDSASNSFCVKVFDPSLFMVVLNCARGHNFQR